MTRKRLLVVGVGNPDRGDDGIGPAVVDAVRAEPDLPDVETAVAAGDLSDLIVTWTPDHDVVVVDAMNGGGPPGSVTIIDGLGEQLPVGPRSLSSHGFGLADTVQLARALGRLPGSLTIVAVQVGGTDHLAPLSEPAQGAVTEVVTMIAALAAPGQSHVNWGPPGHRKRGLKTAVREPSDHDAVSTTAAWTSA